MAGQGSGWDRTGGEVERQGTHTAGQGADGIARADEGMGGARTGGRVDGRGSHRERKWQIENP